MFEEAIEKVHHDVQQVVEAVVDAGDYQVGGTEGHSRFSVEVEMIILQLALQPLPEG